MAALISKLEYLYLGILGAAVYYSISIFHKILGILTPYTRTTIRRPSFRQYANSTRQSYAVTCKHRRDPSPEHHAKVEVERLLGYITRAVGYLEI